MRRPLPGTPIRVAPDVAPHSFWDREHKAALQVPQARSHSCFCKGVPDTTLQQDPRRVVRGASGVASRTSRAHRSSPRDHEGQGVQVVLQLHLQGEGGAHTRRVHFSMPRHEQDTKQGTRSVMCGSGPARPPPCAWRGCLKARSEYEPLAEGGPINPVCAVALGCGFNVEGDRVRIRPPGFGCSSSWICMCMRRAGARQRCATRCSKPCNFRLWTRTCSVDVTTVCAFGWAGGMSMFS